MFSSRVIQRVVTRGSQVKKLSQTAPLRDGIFREKTFSEIWFHDKGAYPVMSISVIGALACVAFGAFYVTTSPDVRLTPGKSRSRMFRGEISEDYLKEEVDVCK